MDAMYFEPCYEFSQAADELVGHTITGVEIFENAIIVHTKEGRSIQIYGGNDFMLMIQS